MAIRTAFYLSVLLIAVLLVVFARDLQPRAAPEAAPAKTSGDDPDLLGTARALAAGIDPAASAEALFAGTCAACHGAAGEGNAELRSPAIGGLPDWYLVIQLEKFRNGQRGEGVDDVGGAQMKLIAEALDEAQIPVIAEHVQQYPLTATERTLPGDPERGKTIFLQSCAGCHRYNAHGEKAFRSAPLSSLQDWYLLASMKNYRDGRRGYHRHDIDGIFMHRNLEYFTDEDFQDIVAHIAELAEQHPPDRRRPRNSRRYGDEPFDRPDADFEFPEQPAQAAPAIPLIDDPFDEPSARGENR